MIRRVCLSIVIFVLCAMVGSGRHSFAQTYPLPQDILFYEIDYAQKPIQYQLSLLDAKSQTIKPFYHDLEFAYWPVAWSPSGRFLAAIKIIDTLFGQLCLFTREGKLDVCIKQNISSDLYSGKGNRMIFKVQWSEDENSIYYIGVGEGYQFYEASTQTGEVLRILYSGTTMNWRGEFSWNSQRDVIIEDVRNINLGRTEGVTNFVQINLTDPSKSVKLPFKYLIAGVVEERYTDDDTKHLLSPCPFSPKGTFVAAYDTYAANPLLFALLDKRGNIVERIQRTSEIPLPVNCPVWSSDESAFFYWAPSENTRIYKYLVAQKRAELFYESDIGFLAGADYKVSEDQNFLLNISQQPVSLETPIPENARAYTYKLLVLGPGNSLQFLGNNYSGSVLPLWVPPLKN